MAREIAGRLQAAGLRLAVVASRTNGVVTARLIEGALDAVRRCGGDEAEVEVVRVPGAFEVPGVARALLLQGRHDAIVGLGVVLQGATPHFDFVATEAVGGLAELAREAAERRVAVGMGILTCASLEQALERAGGKMGNKGAEAMQAAIELGDLHRQLRSESRRRARTK